MHRFFLTCRWACGLTASALLALQLGGGTPAARLLDRLDAASRRPLPSLAPSAAPRTDMIWMPDRYVPTLEAPHGVRIPAHWEQRLSEREFYVPPLTVCDPASGACRSTPAGIMGPVELRPPPAFVPSAH